MKTRFGTFITFSRGFAFDRRAPGALMAHHGSAIYDESKAVQVDGVVTDWVWANPHCLLEFDAKNDKGEKASLDRRSEQPA